MKSFRIVCMSDSHGFYKPIEKIVQKQPSADMYVFLGDGMGYIFDNEETDIQLFLKNHPQYSNKFYSVRGNCDDDSSIPFVQIIDAPKHRIFATHGHKYSVGGGLDRIISAAKKEDCDIVLYGHTHTRYSNYTDDGMYIMNPGSCAVPRDGKKPSFGIIDLFENGTILTNIADV